MRRLFALALAVGLLPAASGGAACVAHWVGGDLHAQSAGHRADEPASHEHMAHAAYAPASHEHMASDAHAPASHEHIVHAPAESEHHQQGPHAPVSHDTEAPCTALASCGVLAAVDAPSPARTPTTPAAAVRSGVHLAPPGPAPAPDVPPPRR